MFARRLLPIMGLLLCLGCNQEGPESRAFREGQKKAAIQDAEPLIGQGNEENNQVALESPPVKDQPEQPRKIIFTALLDLIVEDLDKAERELTQLVARENGYVAKSEVRGSPGSPRSGLWTVRVPVDHFDAFREAAGKLGELGRSTSDSDDITDRYFDLKAHLKNDQVEEEGLRKLLLEKSAGGKLEDILVLRKELRTVRGQIEQQQGQINRWDKQTALATITLNIHDRKDYVPPASPGLRASIGRTFDGSLSTLETFGRGVLLTIVALAPWFPILALVIVPGWFWVRHAKAKAPAA